MISSLIVLSTLASADGSSSGGGDIINRLRLPQHKVPTAKRKLKYPINHPLGRHLQQDQLLILDEKGEEEYDGGSSDSNIIGGDGSQYRQRQLQLQQQQQHNNRFLRFFQPTNNGAQSPHHNHNTHKRRRRNSNNISIEEPPQSIQEGELLENDNNEDEDEDEEKTTKLKFWSISGASLSKSAQSTHINHISGNDNNSNDDNDNDGKLLSEEEYQNGLPYKIFPRPMHRPRGSGGENEEKDIILEEEVDVTGQYEHEYEYYADQHATKPTLDDEAHNPIEKEGDDAESESFTTLYKPIRIRAILTSDPSSGSSFLTNTQRQILLQDIINPALYAWTEALHLVPVGVGGYDRGRGDDLNEHVHDGHRRRRDAEKEEENDKRREEGSNNSDSNSDDKLVIDQSQLYDGITCGPGLDSGFPSVKVPTEHMTEGLADTDTVIYVSVSFTSSESADGDELFSSTNTDEQSKTEEDTSSSSSFETMYHLHRDATGPKYTRKRDNNETTSIFNDDSELEDDTNISDNTTTASYHHQSMSPTTSPISSPAEHDEPNILLTRPTCPGTYLASSTYCNTDQYDRPIAGMLHLCIPSHDIHNFFHDTNYIKRNVVTMMHEVGHILGFNAQSLSMIRNPDTGEPLTPRDEMGNVPDSTVECTGVSPRMTVDNIPLPSEDIMKFRTVRGGVRVATLVTPTVTRVARNMFGCSNLVGAELEHGEGQLFGFVDDTATGASSSSTRRELESDNIDNDGNGDDESASLPLFSLSPGECIGDHWSRRLYRTDLMNAIVDDAPYTLHISSLTLAYFADTGWYKVNADRIAPPSMWGRNAGCDFANKKCLTAKGRVSAHNNQFFCNNFLKQVVEPPVEDDKKNKFKKKQEEEVSEIHGCSLDSSRKAMCSLVEYESDSIPEEYNYFKGDNNLDHSQSYGGSDHTLDYCPVFEGFVNGQCTDKRSAKLMGVSSMLEAFGEANSRCVIGHVDKERTALCLQIACVIQDASLMVKVDGYWKTCSYAGQVISLWWNPNDYVVCPDPSRMCPSFYCPNDCLMEGGVCDYQTGQCMCGASSTAALKNTSSSFSPFYTYQRLEPCSPRGEYNVPPHLGVYSNGTFHAVERVDFELPDYYVVNTTVLTDEPRDFDDKVSRMFAQLSTGEVVGLVASFMFCAIFTYIIWSQLFKCYKRRVMLLSSLSRGAQCSVDGSGERSLSGLLRIASGSSLANDNDGDENEDDMDAPPHRRNRGHPQKDKMVATLLVQMRTQEEQQRRLELGGLTTSPSVEDSYDPKKKATVVVDLPPINEDLALVNRSELPPLPDGGRVLAIVGAHIVEDERIGDGSVTSATHTSQSLNASEFTSPLYQDDNNEERSNGVRNLRLRRHME